ncbi:PH domain-containing protein [Fodinibius sp.]|uniref:PH domain-containing protein n=1 Tax=Fodinibius sp. TaxID=1872440 RepID=UPI002ACEF151|nr:PH domain-containing protein [Fodinibius sp.]MDZ7660726.1 PH domain-containing protein [Fodinibius sp.]
MANQTSNRSITLEPSWRNHLLGYILSVLFIPLFGVGLIGLYWVYKRQKTYKYTFTDTKISSQDDKYQRNIDLVNIESVSVQQSWLQKKTSIGDIKLETTATSMTLRGIADPFALKDTLEKAISIQKELQKKEEHTKPEQPDRGPGTMERMDYLTGLWQQGLVSDEDFEKEKKHFE